MDPPTEKKKKKITSNHNLQFPLFKIQSSNFKQVLNTITKSSENLDATKENEEERVSMLLAT